MEWDNRVVLKECLLRTIRKLDCIFLCFFSSADKFLVLLFVTWSSGPVDVATLGGGSAVDVNRLIIMMMIMNLVVTNLNVVNIV